MSASPKRPENEDPSSVSACPVCERRFIIFTRKNNCLGCGKVFCAKYDYESKRFTIKNVI